MPADSQNRVAKEDLGSPAHIRRAERALQKDLRFMIRENARRRARNEKGPGGVRRPDEFAELRRAKLEVSRRAAELVEDEFGKGAARMFRLRANVRMALSFVPDWAAKLLPRGAGRPNQSRHDEGQPDGPAAQQYSGAAPVINPDQRGRAADWVNAAEGKRQRRTAHTAAALSELMMASPDLQAWYRTDPGVLNRTRDLYAAAEQRHVERAGLPTDLSSFQYTGRPLSQAEQMPMYQDAQMPQYQDAQMSYYQDAQLPQRLGQAPSVQYPGQEVWPQYSVQGQWSQPTTPVPWSPNVAQAPPPQQVERQSRIERKPLSADPPVAHAASLTSPGALGRSGSVTPPPVQHQTPKPRQVLK
jgi:hypothetical protein